jgi:hypothetical protein
MALREGRQKNEKTGKPKSRVAQLVALRFRSPC